MNLLFWGLTLGVIGKVMLACGVLMAHSELAKEHRIDASVLRVFKTERWLTIIGLTFIVFGYVLEMFFYGFFTNPITCQGSACAAAVGSFLQ